MENNEREALEAYRKERKERIAKQAKSNSKKSHGMGGNSKVVDKVISIIISVVLVVAIVAGILSFAGVPQRMVKAVSIDGESYSMAELSCYYMQMFTSTFNTAYSYDSQYGEGYGKMLTKYDVSLAPDAQSTTDEDGNTVTWDEYFMDMAIESMANIKRYYKLAQEAGIKIDEDAQAEIDETLDSIMTNAGDYSMNSVLKRQFGAGVNKTLFKKVLMEQQLVALYQESKQEEYRNNYTADDINAVYAKDKTAYDSVGFRWFTIDVEESTSKETTSGETTSEAAAKVLPEETKAQSFIDKVKSQANYNEETFKKVVLEFADEEDLDQYKQDAATKLQKVDKETIETNINEDAAKWLYEVDENGNYVRQAGDMKYFLNSDSTTVYILYAIGTPFKDTTNPVSVRHILVQFPEETTAEATSGEDTSESAEEATVAAEVKAECYSEAESILDKYNSYINENTSGKADEDYFVELVSEFSDDTGSASSGGLIEDMKNDGSYVAAFEDWAFSEGEYEGEDRVAGSTAIIETEYGYHVMYYVQADEHPVWYETILTDLVDEAWEKEQTAFEEQTAEDAIERKWGANRVLKSCVKNIKMYYVSN